MRSAGATVYLFGTVHVLKPEIRWLSPKISRAFAASSEVWEEIEDDRPDLVTPLVRQLGVDLAHSLHAKLTGPELARVDLAAKTLGLPGGEAALDPLRPWAAAAVLTVAPLVQAGYDPASGVDKVLRRKAQTEGKRLHAFETVEQQMHFLADLPPALELAFLRATLDELADGPAKLDRFVAAWQKGDVEAVSELDQDMQRESPELFRRLVVDRNMQWADRITGWLGRPGVRFVAVGSAHLAGPGSLQEALTARGREVERE